MKSAVIVFPGSNCDRDVAVALEQAAGKRPEMVWHAETTLPKIDLIVVPGGFSFGDYLRCGAMAGKSPVMTEVARAAEAGVPVLGICNGFQILTETGILPGVLMSNASLKFVCRDVRLRVENTSSSFTNHFDEGERISVPVAHHDGNYFADDDTLAALEDNDQIAFRYDDDNPNGSAKDIAGIFNRRKTVLGMMPHPERVIGEELGGTDGLKLFASLAASL